MVVSGGCGMMGGWGCQVDVVYGWVVVSGGRGMMGGWLSGECGMMGGW